MPKERDRHNCPTAEERRKRARLEKEMESVLDRLAETPSDARLASRLSEIEIAVVRITKEKTIDY